MVEYALILVLVAIVVIAVLLVLGPLVGNVFSQVACTLKNPGSSTCQLASANPNANSAQFHHIWNACGGSCTNTYVTCAVNTTVVVAYYPNGSGQGSTGNTAAISCTSSQTYSGNFFAGQRLVATDNTTGAVLADTTVQ